jgi:replicative DNA helicase
VTVDPFTAEPDRTIARLRQLGSPPSPVGDDRTWAASCPRCGGVLSLVSDGGEHVALTCWGGCERREVDLLLFPPEPVAAAPRRAVDGASFILDAPEQVPAVWGQDNGVLWSQGEPLLICGPPGVGKSSLAQQLALRRHGVLEGDLLGMPVQLDPRRVLYIAADRPYQIARSLRRMVGEEHRAALSWLTVWPGPLPFDLAAKPERLAEFALEHEAGTIIIDSLKDVALDLSKDETGSRVNQALQHVVAAGVEVVANHHQRKDGAGGSKPKTLADVYGSGWLTAGVGSVVLLWGKAGDPIVELLHLKPPADEVGPLTIIHDHEAGTSALHEPVDLRAMLTRAPGPTAGEAAQRIYGVSAPGRNEVEKARRRLEAEVKAGRAVREEGGHEGVRYRAVSTREEVGA